MVKIIVTSSLGSIITFIIASFINKQFIIASNLIKIIIIRTYIISHNNHLS